MNVTTTRCKKCKRAMFGVAALCTRCAATEAVKCATCKTRRPLYGSSFCQRCSDALEKQYELTKADDGFDLFARVKASEEANAAWARGEK